MQKTYEVPEVKLIGHAGELVMGTIEGGFDIPFQSAPDFEFEQDSL